MYNAKQCHAKVRNGHIARHAPACAPHHETRQAATARNRGLGDQACAVLDQTRLLLHHACLALGSCEMGFVNVGFVNAGFVNGYASPSAAAREPTGCVNVGFVNGVR